MKRRSRYLVTDKGHLFSATFTTKNPAPGLVNALKEMVDKAYKIHTKCQDKKKGKDDPCQYPVGTCFQCLNNH